MKHAKEEQLNAKGAMKALLTKGQAVYIVVGSVSSSGMSRRMRFFVHDGGRLSNITYSLACLLDYPLNDKGLRLDGCGMDMGFHALDNALYAIYGVKDRPVGANDLFIQYL